MTGPTPDIPEDDDLLPAARRSVLADDVYDILRASLLSHRISPGARLNLDQLAKKLHVSNTPVRQALARLEADGLVTKEPYRGFAASRLLDARAIVELYEYRLLIEPSTAARAARRRSEGAVEELLASCSTDTLSQLSQDPSKAAEFPQRDVNFHCAIAGEAGNSVILENLSQLMTRMRLYSVYGQLGAADQAWAEHRVIAAAIRDGDADAARDAMRVHLTSSLDRFKKAVG